MTFAVLHSSTLSHKVTLFSCKCHSADASLKQRLAEPVKIAETAQEV